VFELTRLDDWGGDVVSLGAMA